MPATSNLPPKPGDADTLRPNKSTLQERTNKSSESSPATNGKIQSQEEMLGNNEPIGDRDGSAGAASEGENGDMHGGQVNHSKDPGSSSVSANGQGDDSAPYDIDQWEPKPPKVFMENPEAVPLELHSQIQLYATTESVFHSPHSLVDPILIPNVI